MKSKPHRPKARRGSRRASAPSRFGPIVVVATIATLAGLLYFGGRGSGGTDAAVGDAPAFTLPSTDGGRVSLADHAGRDVLLYFNEGVGCDSCFYQMVELEENAALFSDAGIEILPIVANPLSDVANETARFGLRTPYLSDADARVSAAYGVLGNGMHAGVPGHTFVLVDGSGDIRWSQEYPSMFVSANELLAALPLDA